MCDGSVRELVMTEGAPPGAPYSSAAVVGDLVWTSGALPTESDGSVSADFSTQVRTALANLERLLDAAGADFTTVVKINGYVSDIERLPELNAVYVEVVGGREGQLPPRTTVEVARFRGGTMVEFDAVAVRRREGSDA